MNEPIKFPETWFHRGNPFRILVVDPNRKLAGLLGKELGDQVRLERANTADTALQMLALTPFDLMILQLKLPLFSGVDLAKRVRRILPELDVLTLSSEASEAESGEIVRLGYPPPVAFPAEEAELVARVRENIEGEEWALRLDWLRVELKRRYGFDQMLSACDAMAMVHERLRKVVNSRVPVLITGESGTGKELVARMIHTSDAGSERKPFITVNCAAVPEGLLESQFFGHEKGAFTGAVSQAQGKFELANHGTLFLDEIGEMSPGLQAKLLRVLEYGEFERVGGSQTLKVDVRLITATNRDLAEEVTLGNFRSDLYYRINVFPIELPPLREREDDVLLLAYNFLKRASNRNNRHVRFIHPDAVEMLRSYPWPGNIRELDNIIERAILLSNGVRLMPGDFPQVVEWKESGVIESPRPRGPAGTTHKPVESSAQESEGDGNGQQINRTTPPLSPPETGGKNILYQVDRVDGVDEMDIVDGKAANNIPTLKEVEHRAIENALAKTNGNIALAARKLGISRNTLYRKIEEHGIRLLDD